MRRLLLSLLLCGLFAGQCLAAAADTLIVGRGVDANSLDPGECQNFDAILSVDHAFDGLVRYDGNSLNIVPALAVSWTMSEDGKTWIFKLRPGVKFHDGTPFNAEAVVFSLERQRDKSHPYYSKYFTRWTTKLDNVLKTEALDEMTVQITLKEPTPSLLANLSFYTGYIVSPTAVKNDKEGFRNKPVGTGYYKVNKWVKDEYIEYEANPDYWDGPPKAQKLILRVIPDNQIRLLALEKGDIHAAYNLDVSTYDAIKQNKDLELHTSISLGSMFMSLNAQKKPFDNLKVRQAVLHAIDRNRLFNIVFYGYGEFANQTLPSHWYGHNSNVKSLSHDPAKAKKLLAEAGFPNGFKVNLIAFTGARPYCPSPRDFVTLIKSDLARVGIDVDIQIMNWGTFREARDKGEYDMTLGGYIAGTLDPDGLLYVLEHSKFIRNLDRGNYPNYNNPEIDALLDAARATYDEKERDALYKKVAALIDEASVNVFVVHPMNALAARKNVKNLFIHGSTWVPLHKTYVEQK